METRTIKYSGDPKTGHSKTGFIRKPADHSKTEQERPVFECHLKTGHVRFSYPYCTTVFQLKQSMGERTYITHKKVTKSWKKWSIEVVMARKRVVPRLVTFTFLQGTKLPKLARKKWSRKQQNSMRTKQILDSIKVQSKLSHVAIVDFACAENASLNAENAQGNRL